MLGIASVAKWVSEVSAEPSRNLTGEGMGFDLGQ
ncbi:hypothetical protein Tco_1581337, partial [Tanacetum coccineum]